MGYTQYWQQSANAYTYDSFNELCGMISEIVATAAKEPWSIGIEMVDLGSDDVICLNGASLDGSDDEDLAHEDFAIERFGSGFKFCKTARKPYDTVVVASLIAAELIANRNSVSLDLSSDGEVEEWSDGVKLFEACFPGLLATADVRLSGDRLEYAGSVISSQFRRGQLRIWWINYDSSDETFNFDIKTIEEGRQIIASLTAYDVFMRGGVVKDTAGGIEEFTGEIFDLDDINDGWYPVDR